MWYEIKKLKVLLRQMNVVISHMYKESIRIVDYLDNMGLKEMRFIVYRQWELLPKFVRGLLKLDKLVINEIFWAWSL